MIRGSGVLVETDVGVPHARERNLTTSALKLTPTIHITIKKYRTCYP